MMRQLCAWCGLELAPGDDPPSHGICGPCGVRWVVRGQTTEQLLGRLRWLSLDVEGLTAAAEEQQRPTLVQWLERAVAETTAIHAELVRRARGVAETATLK